MYILSGKKITAVYPMSRRWWDQNTTQVDNRLDTRQGKGYIRPVTPYFLHAPPRPLRVAKPGKNHLNKEITPLLPTGLDERFSQTTSNLEYAALLRRCKLHL